MKQIGKILITILALFFVFLITGRVYMSLTEEWYIEIYPNRFLPVTSIILFTALTLVSGIAGYFVRLNKVVYSKKEINLSLTVLIVLKVMLFFVFYTKVELSADFKTYYLVADALAKNDIFIPEYIAVFPHVIGYPFFLSILFRIFTSSVEVGLIFNLLLSCCSILLIFSIVKQLKNEKSGMLAAFFYTIMPSSTMYGYLLCTEFLFQTILLASIYIFLYLLSVKLKSKFFVLSFVNGALIGVLASIRPNGLILLIALIMTVVLFVRKFEVELKPKVLVPCMCGVYIVAFVLTSAISNYYIERTIRTDIAENKLGWNLYVGLNQESLGTWNLEDAELFGQILAEKGAVGTQQELFVRAVRRFEELKSPSAELSFFSKKTLKMWTQDHEVYDYITAALGDSKPWWIENQSILK